MILLCNFIQGISLLEYGLCVSLLESPECGVNSAVLWEMRAYPSSDPAVPTSFLLELLFLECPSWNTATML